MKHHIYFIRWYDSMQDQMILGLVLADSYWEAERKAKKFGESKGWELKDWQHIGEVTLFDNPKIIHAYKEEK